MLPFTTLVVGSAASLFLAAHTPALAGTMPRSAGAAIHLVCDSTADAGFCRALADAIGAQADGRAVVLGDDPGAAPVPDALVLRFVTERRNAASLAGHLAWRTATGDSGQGPTMEISVVDTALNPELMRTYAAELVRYSALPI